MSNFIQVFTEFFQVEMGSFRNEFTVEYFLFYRPICHVVPVIKTLDDAYLEIGLAALREQEMFISAAQDKGLVGLPIFSSFYDLYPMEIYETSWIVYPENFSLWRHYHHIPSGKLLTVYESWLNNETLGREFFTLDVDYETYNRIVPEFLRVTWEDLWNYTSVVDEVPFRVKEYVNTYELKDLNLWLKSGGLCWENMTWVESWILYNKWLGGLYSRFNLGFEALSNWVIDAWFQFYKFWIKFFFKVVLVEHVIEFWEALNIVLYQQDELLLLDLKFIIYFYIKLGAYFGVIFFFIYCLFYYLRWLEIGFILFLNKYLIKVNRGLNNFLKIVGRYGIRAFKGMIEVLNFFLGMYNIIKYLIILRLWYSFLGNLKNFIKKKSR